METILRPCPPYDFNLALKYVARSDLEIVEKADGGRYRRLFEIDGRCYPAELTSVGTVDKPALRLKVTDADEAVLTALAAKLTRMFNLTADLAAFYDRVAADPVLPGLAARFRGLKPVLAASLFESLAWAIIGQQVNLRFAYSLKRTLVELCGGRYACEGEVFYSFPGPETVARLDYTDLTGRKFSGKKAEYLIDFARGVTDGKVRLDRLTDLSLEEVIAELTALRGIGRWTAEYCLLRGLGHPDALLAGDIGLRNAVTTYYGLPAQATEKEVRALGEAWSGWGSYATFYLWFALAQDKKVAQGG